GAVCRRCAPLVIRITPRPAAVRHPVTSWSATCIGTYQLALAKTRLADRGASSPEGMLCSAPAVRRRPDRPAVRRPSLHALTSICASRHISWMTDAPWAALTDPKRRAALDLLRQRPRAVTELVDALKLSQPTTSKHLRVLREAGLVTVLPDAQRRIYAIDP